MRQSVKGTKWITKCRVGLWVGGWVGGGWSQGYFSIPWWLACWQWGGKSGVRDSEGGGVRGGGVTLPEIKPAPPDLNCSICTAYGEIRERKLGRTKAVSLFEYQSPSLFGQAGFACWVFSWSPGAGWGGVGGWKQSSSWCSGCGCSGNRTFLNRGLSP